MTNSISSTALAALGLALVGSPAANAQTVITRQISDPSFETVITQQPVQTVQTTETVRTMRPGAKPTVRRVVTTRQTVVSQSQRVAPAQPLYDEAPVVAARTYTPPLYDTYAPRLYDTYAPRLYDNYAPRLYDSYTPRLYDTVAPVPTVDDTVINAAPPVAAIPTYRYVYEPDRILVIDPVTNVAIQSIPR